jgi:hypothetical protein
VTSLNADTNATDAFNELYSFMREFGSESERAFVILVSSRIDILLQHLLCDSLLAHTGSSDELFDGDAPLSSFHAKIQLAYRMGLIDSDLTRALNIVRRIRNSFAHELSGASLKTGPYQDRVRELISPFRKTWIVRYFNDGHFLPKNIGTDSEFAVVLSLIISRLQWAILHTNRPSATHLPVRLINPYWLDPKNDPTPKPPDQASPTQLVAADN